MIIAIIIIIIIIIMRNERIVVCGITEKGGKQEREDNIEAKNLPNDRTLMTTTRLPLHSHALLNFKPASPKVEQLQL